MLKLLFVAFLVDDQYGYSWRIKKQLTKEKILLYSRIPEGQRRCDVVNIKTRLHSVHNQAAHNRSVSPKQSR